MSEIDKKTQGIFIPNKNKIETLPHEVPYTPLTGRENFVLETLAGDETNGTFGVLTTTTLRHIVTEEIGEHAAVIDPRKELLLRFLGKTIVAADEQFDRQRISFSSTKMNPEQFYSTFTSSKIPVKDGSISLQDAFTIVEKKLTDQSLYPEGSGGIVTASMTDLKETAIKEFARNDSLELNGKETQQVKEGTNGIYAKLLFDILMAPYAGQDGYNRARDRFVATVLANQYRDDVQDGPQDYTEGSANLFVAHARDLGELNEILDEQRYISANGKKPTIVFENPSGAFNENCAAFQGAAPLTYEAIRQRQQELLDIAALPKDIEVRIILPNNP